MFRGVLTAYVSPYAPLTVVLVTLMPPVAVDVPGSEPMIALPPSELTAGVSLVALSGAANVAATGEAITPMAARAKSVTAFVRRERFVSLVVDKMSPSVLM